MGRMELKKINSPGFTLLEMLITAVIAGFIAIVGVSGLRSITTARAMVEDASERTDELRYAADEIRRDIESVYARSSGFRFEGLTDWAQGREARRLIFRTYRREPLRKGEPEGDLYEVEYFLGGKEGESSLMRRVCPIVGMEQPDQSSGGVIEELARVDYFDVLFYDGKEWSSQWPPELLKLPELVMVTLRYNGDKGRVWAREFAVQFVQGPSSGNMEELEFPEGQE
jgi:general secretion pathway protein J